MLIALLLATALAEPVDLAKGEDLTAIRAIETADLTDEQAIEAWRAFLVAYPDSPLATLAWRELDRRDAAHGDWVPPDRSAAIARVARLARAEDEEVERVWVGTSVAELQPDGQPLVSELPTWMSRVEADVGWDGGVFGAFGAGLGKGPALGSLRIGRQRTWYVEVAGRLKGPLSFGPWLEIHADSLLRVGASGGGEVLLWDNVSLEGRGGLLVDHGEVFPRVATVLVYRLPAPRALRLQP